MADDRRMASVLERVKPRLQLGQFGVPVLLTSLLVVLAFVDATQAETADFPYAALIILGAGILTIPISPWILVGAVLLAGLTLIFIGSSFLGMASITVPIAATYLAARRQLRSAIALSVALLIAFSFPPVLLGYETSIVFSTLVFWTVVVTLAVVAGVLIRFVLDREEAASKQNQEALDRLSSQLSRDLHDSVGGVLTRVSLLAQQARASDADKAAENLDLIVAETHAASSEVRLLLSRLRDVDDMIRGDAGGDLTAAERVRSSKKPVSAKPGDPVVAHGPMTVRQLLKSYSDRLRVYGFAVESAVEPQASEALEQYVRLLGRLLDESILNTIKYASPDEPVHAVFTRSETHVKVVLSNTESPEGNPNPADSSGLGLANLARDIEAAGGILTTGRLTPPVVEGAEATDSQWQLCVELPAAPAGQPTPHTEVPSDNR